MRRVLNSTCCKGLASTSIWNGKRASVTSAAPGPSEPDIVLLREEKIGRKAAARQTMLVEAEKVQDNAALDLAKTTAAPTVQRPPSLVETFVEELEAQADEKNRELNRNIPMPDDPASIVPEFRRVLKNSRTVFVVEDPENPKFARRDNFVDLPAAEKHPWIMDQPIGPNIVHGDGQQNIVGTGEVGFDDKVGALPLPTDYRGLQHTSIAGSRLPQRNGFTSQDLIVKHSFKISGRGVFAQKKIAKGEILMVVGSTAQHTGIEGEVNRLGHMVADILNTVANSGSDEDFEFLHQNILTGQLSSIIERWPQSATDKVIELIGGEATLEKLQLHPLHIGRIAAVIDMNNFLVESMYAERHGCGYWPEAGLLNHSCAPNCSYEIVPQHTFPESEFYLDMLSESERKKLEESRRKEELENIPKAQMSTQAAKKERPGTIVAEIPREMTIEEIQSQIQERQAAWQQTDLTASGTPQMLFCMRAERDIEAGEELLISYVPSEWSFDARQIALQHRYRFWCRCEKCSPSVDRSYAILPRISVYLIIFVVLLQMLAHVSRSAQMRSEEDILLDDEGYLPEGNDRGRSGAWRRPGESLLESMERSRWERAMYGDNIEAERAKNKRLYAGDPYAIKKF